MNLPHMRAVLSAGLLLSGAILAVLTLSAFGAVDRDIGSVSFQAVLWADCIYGLLIAGLILLRVQRLRTEQRRQYAGSRLHMRLTGIFVLVTLLPTILVATFAVFIVNIGIESWFSDRVQRVVGSSFNAAQAYEREHREDLIKDAQALAGYLNATKQTTFFLADTQLRPLLSEAQEKVQRGLREAFLIDGAGVLRTRGDKSYLFDYEKPVPDQILRAKQGETVVIQDWANNEFRALIYLTAFPDRYLYISRAVDGSLLGLLDDTKETVASYQQVEKDRGRILVEFALLYLGFALILILVAIWIGLWFAERLSRPIGRLANAALHVGDGDLDVRVIEEKGDDEIATLGRVFNQMTRQLKVQRDALVDSHHQTELRRRLFDSVLSSVTAGVIGLNAEGEIDFVNRAGRRLLDGYTGHEKIMLAQAIPEFSALFARLCQAGGGAVQEEIWLTRQGKMENLLVRMSERTSETGILEGYVIAFDDVTELVSAQRMAAWGDVARRIAHEIKNPLTPIQLSAERIKRKFRPLLGDHSADLEQYADVIIRQTNDLRRIVDEFSKFARMPQPDRREVDLVKIIQDAVILQDLGLPDVRLKADLPETPLLMAVDATMIGQALTNLIKNAGEAIEDYIKQNNPQDYHPEIRVICKNLTESVVITIADNGKGLPVDRSRLFEPYMTTREKGTGLGLPIVKKIIEEHGGSLLLHDACLFEGNDHAGAMVEISLPHTLDVVRRQTVLKAIGR